MSDYRIQVTKDYLIFCCAHSISHADGKWEPLHGHNYRLGVTVAGPLGPAGYVLDFVTLKQLMRFLVNRLDHHVLLAADNPHQRLTIEDEQVNIVRNDGKRYSFPLGDTAILPIANTTAEWLAHYFACQLATELRHLPVGDLETVEVEVEETPGQSAWHRFAWAAP